MVAGEDSLCGTIDTFEVIPPKRRHLQGAADWLSAYSRLVFVFGLGGHGRGDAVGKCKTAVSPIHLYRWRMPFVVSSARFSGPVGFRLYGPAASAVTRASLDERF